MDKGEIVLTINCGSSSIKYKIFSFPSERVIDRGIVEHIGEEFSDVKNHHDGIEQVLNHIFKLGIKKEDIFVIGHRVVHGGEKFFKPTVIDSKVTSEIKLLSRLAPLHNPANLEGIRACMKILKGIKQVAVFDTAFHHAMPKYAYMYGLPYDYYRKAKVRKYGFHGTSHSYVAMTAAKKLKKPLKSLRLITCHLGNGCSISAIENGRSIDTSMGFTPLEGLLMGTRSGDLDPAVVLYLMKRYNMSIETMDNVLNKKSGLLGISGVSNDFRELVKAREKGNKRAELAIEMFKYRILKYVGAYAMALGKIDAVVFTGGIGENVKEIRAYVGKKVKSLIGDNVKIMVIPTDEELMIARHSYSLTKD